MRGEQVALPHIEYRLLLFFLLNPERVHGRDELRQAVWGADVYVATRTVDVHIANLRQALQPWGYDRLLETRRGAGYLLRVSEEGSAKAGPESRS
jgi:two-component system phosphate regulon response regulator PhoB